MSDQPTRGGRRPGAGRKPGQGKGTNPQIYERVPPDLAAYCKSRQASEPGYLARLLRAEQAKEDSMPGTVSEPLQKPRRDVGLCSHPNYDPLLDLRESARYLSISEDSMGDLARNRQIAVVRSTNNGKMRFRLSVLNAWVKSHELKALRSAV